MALPSIQCTSFYIKKCLLCLLRSRSRVVYTLKSNMIGQKLKKIKLVVFTAIEYIRIYVNYIIYFHSMYVIIEYLMKEKVGVKFINIFILRSQEEKKNPNHCSTLYI